MKSKSANPKIVVIGGGTGSYTLLKELKKVTNNITALVTMADDGGSTGLLRDQYGVLPPGDVRQCLVALSNSSEQIRTLFNYRFGEGAMDGHSFGNLFLTAVEKMTDDFGQAVKLASQVLNITGQVIPITLDNTHLFMLDDNKEIKGEYKIGNSIFEGKNKPEFKLFPHAWINDKAKEAILQADVIVIAPGNLYGTIVPALIVDGVSQALEKTRAKLVQVTNLVTKPGQTDNWQVNDYVEEIERFTQPRKIDYVIYNTKKPTKEMLNKYAYEHEFPVLFHKSGLTSSTFRAIGTDLIDGKIEKKNANDKIDRTLIRHDGAKIAAEIVKICNQKNKRKILKIQHG
jgi:uncharacterized cofD-like protein